MESRHRRRISVASEHTDGDVGVADVKRQQHARLPVLVGEQLAGRKATSLAPDLELELPLLTESDEPSLHDP